jgi:uncharacterized protein YuzE
MYEMKVRYDADVDVLSILLSDGLVEESDETKPGVVMDDDQRELVELDDSVAAEARMESLWPRLPV